MDDEGIFNIGERVVFSFGEELSKGYPKDGMTGVVVEEYVGIRSVLFDEIYEEELSERERKWDVGVEYLKPIKMESDDVGIEDIDIKEMFENYLKEICI